jgi:hypothetical protein
LSSSLNLDFQSVFPYGALGLELMRTGIGATEALRGLLAADARGGVAAHTGAMAIAAAGHILGDQFSVQANMMLRETVWAAMARVFAGTRGELVDRMLAALDAAEAEGGDIRGMQSSAVLIVAPQSTGRPWADKIFDLRVEDHRAPLGELRCVVAIRRAYVHQSAADRAFARGDYFPLTTRRSRTFSRLRRPASFRASMRTKATDGASLFIGLGFMRACPFYGLTHTLLLFTKEASRRFRQRFASSVKHSRTRHSPFEGVVLRSQCLKKFLMLGRFDALLDFGRHRAQQSTQPHEQEAIRIPERPPYVNCLQKGHSQLESSGRSMPNSCA